MKFHPSEDKTVISGSTDGIINLFDVTQTTEKDALQSCFNTNSSVVSEIFLHLYYIQCIARLRMFCM